MDTDAPSTGPSATTGGRTSQQVDVMLHVDHALIKVPLEQLSRLFRSAEKAAEKELQSSVTAAEEVFARAFATPEQRTEAAAQLDAILTKLQNIKQKMVNLHAEQETCLRRCDARILHMEQMCAAFENGKTEEAQQFTRQRFDRILIDHLLREGYYQTATTLAEVGRLGDLVDIDMFLGARKIETSLMKHSCTECLQWCSENRSKLRKLKSSLEFNLRLQEYIELVRAGRFTNAINYARKYLIQWMDTNGKDVQEVVPPSVASSASHARLSQALALLAFPNQETRCERYRQLYDPVRWQMLAEQFRNDNFMVYSLTSQSLLSISLQGGLSALKTPMCSELESKVLNCPVCNTEMGHLARSLPHAHHTRSSIVCRLTGAVMDPDNPPVMLPNGNVYSGKALEAMNINQGAIVDPRTGDRYKWSDVRKVFIM